MKNTKHLHDHGNSHDLEHILNQSKKTDDFQKISDIFEKLGDAKRSQIFWILCHCEECVSDLSEIVGMSSPAVSHHLKVLKECGLIESHREGREVIYRACDSELTHLLHVTAEEIMAISCPDALITPESIGIERSHGHTSAVTASDGSQNYKNHNHNRATCSCHNHTGNDASCHNLAKSNNSCPGSATGSNSASHEDLAEQIHEYLNANLDQHITIESLAKHFCVNATTIKTVFRNEFGNSVAAHTKEHRMEKAATLLKTTDLSLGEIAASVGYQSQSKFTSAFKETFHILPKDYRSRFSQ